MYIQLSQEEYNLLIQQRNNKFVLDVSEEEYNFILNTRSETNFNLKIYEKYIENLEKFVYDENSSVASYASKFLDSANKLKLSSIQIDDFRKIDDAIYDGKENNVSQKIDTINYIKNKIAEMYPK